MGDPAGINGTLDIIARTPDLGLLVGGVTREGQEVRLTGALSGSDNFNFSQDVAITLDWAGADFERLDGGLVLSGEDPNGPDAIIEYSAMEALGGRYEIHSGFVTSEEGRRVEVIAAADPVSLIVVGGGMLAAGCLLGAGTNWLIEWIQTRTSGQAEACRAGGGFPKVMMEFKWSFSLRDVGLKCSVAPHFRCENTRGELIEGWTGPEEPVHA
jgi:hypothetical protein